MLVQDKENNQLVTYSVLIITIIAVAIALYFTRSIMIPFILALFVRILIDPIIDFQTKNLKIHRFVAIIVAVIIIIAFFVLVVPFITDSLVLFLKSADDYNTKVLFLIESIIYRLQEFEVEINKDAIIKYFLNLPFLEWTYSTLSNGANFIVKFVLVVIIALFLLAGSSDQKKPGTWDNINKQVKKYIFAKFITSLSTGVLTGIIYWFLGLDLALIFGTLTFLLNFIPTLGSVIAVLLPLPVAFLQFDAPIMIVLIIILPAIVHIIIGNIIEPKIFGQAFNLHPVTIIVALISWGLIWGIIGMLLAVPLTAIIKMLFEQSDTTKPIALLLSGKLHLIN